MGNWDAHFVSVYLNNAAKERSLENERNPKSPEAKILCTKFVNHYYTLVNKPRIRVKDSKGEILIRPVKKILFYMHAKGKYALKGIHNFKKAFLFTNTLFFKEIKLQES